MPSVSPSEPVAQMAQRHSDEVFVTAARNDVQSVLLLVLDAKKHIDLVAHEHLIV